MAFRVLDRDVARVQTEPIREIGDPLLRSVIDEGVGVFERCSHSAPDGDENLGILFPFHHLLEMIDGVHVLLAESAVAAAHPLLRSAFEALTGLKYVLAENTRERALCYVVADVKARIDWYESVDPETERGRRYRADIGHEENPDFPFPDVDVARAAKERLLSLLRSKQYAVHSEEYDRVRKERRRTPQWYSLHGGPVHFRDLAKLTGCLDDYTILYREWSKTTHAADLARQLGRQGQYAAISVIRAPVGIEQRYLFAAHFGIDATRRILEYYRPGELERFRRWYVQEVAEQLTRLERIRTEADN